MHHPSGHFPLFPLPSVMAWAALGAYPLGTWTPWGRVHGRTRVVGLDTRDRDTAVLAIPVVCPNGTLGTCYPLLPGYNNCQ